MRVVVTEAFSAYLNMQPEKFEPGQNIKGSAAAYFLQTGAPVEPLDDEARAVLASTSGELAPKEPPAELDIDAKADDVLAWVGEDPERAAEALAAEQAKDKPRSTLVKQLEKLAGSGE